MKPDNIVQFSVAAATSTRRSPFNRIGLPTKLAALFIPVVMSAAAVVSPGVTSAYGATAPTPPFSQCPAIGADTSCGILITINPDNTATLTGDPKQGPYDGGDDTLVGVQNNSSSSVQSLRLSGPDAFGFDGDGICSGAFAHTPKSCPFGPTGYEGPGVSYSNYDYNSGTVNFGAGSGSVCGSGLAPGASTYFSLENRIDASQLKLSIPTESGQATVVRVGATTLASTGPVSTQKPSTTEAALLKIPVNPVLSGGVGDAKMIAGFGVAEAQASLVSLSVLVPGAPLISLSGVQADSKSSSAGSVGAVNIASLTVGSTVEKVNAVPANTTIPLGSLGSIVLNEQIKIPHGLTVNAIHVRVATLDVVVGSATSAIEPPVPGAALVASSSAGNPPSSR